MDKKALFPIAVIYLLAAAFTWGPAQAKYSVPLNDMRGGQAYGMAEFEKLGYSPGLMSVGMDVFRLQPDTVHTVWYEDEKGERTPAGADRNDFRTGGGGKGRYITSVYDYYLDDWRYIAVYAHPDGDPENTREMVAALRGDLVYGRRP